MCGLFGHAFRPEFLGQLGLESYYILNTVLGFAMDERGRDSWGIARFNPNWEPVITKGLGNIAESIPLRFPKTHPMMIAHTRKATTGAVTLENAHPFHILDGHGVIGAHNGMVSNHYDLKKKWGMDWTVDSEAIFRGIAHDKDLKDIKAFGAITYALGDDSDKLFLGRFNNGQLTIAGVGGLTPENSKGIVWASTESAVKLALRAAGIEEFFFYKVEEGTKYCIENGRLFKMQDIGLNISSAYGGNVGYTGGRGYQGCAPTVPKKNTAANPAVSGGSQSAATSGGLTPRILIPKEEVTPEIIRNSGASNSWCDFCQNAKWEMYLLNERTFLCSNCWDLYCGEEVGKGNGGYNQILYTNTLTRFEILEKGAKAAVDH